MDNFIYVNACRTTLAADITNVQSVIQISNPGRFPPSIPAGQVLVLTIHPDGLPSTQEIIHCTAISADTLTVVRGAQSTAPASWPEGTIIGAYLTADMLDQIADDVRGHAGSGGSAHALATTIAAGFMSAVDKTKLNGVQVGATNYQHPVTHSPTIIAQDLNNRFATDVEKANWNAAKNHADSAHAPSDAQKNSDIMKEEIEARLTGELTSHSHPSNVPAGAVMFFPMSSAPAGFLKANGAAVSRSSYANLFAAIGTRFGAGNGSTTFNLPDLRGEFLRGWADGRWLDAERELGSTQGDAIRRITGTLGGYTGWDSPSANGPFRLSISSQSGGSSGVSFKHGTLTYDNNLVVPTATENRPHNVALLACIKF